MNGNTLGSMQDFFAGRVGILSSDSISGQDIRLYVYLTHTNNYTEADIRFA